MACCTIVTIVPMFTLIWEKAKSLTVNDKTLTTFSSALRTLLQNCGLPVWVCFLLNQATEWFLVHAHALHQNTYEISAAIYMGDSARTDFLVFSHLTQGLYWLKRKNGGEAIYTEKVGGDILVF